MGGVLQEGMVFIGPDAHAMKAMGDKIESKKLAIAAGYVTPKRVVAKEMVVVRTVGWQLCYMYISPWRALLQERGPLTTTL